MSAAEGTALSVAMCGIAVSISCVCLCTCVSVYNPVCVYVSGTHAQFLYWLRLQPGKCQSRPSAWVPQVPGALNRAPATQLERSWAGAARGSIHALLHHLTLTFIPIQNERNFGVSKPVMVK